jgi:anthranilate synthase/aminodeoxychorismate synthase-like glutamine amidotransferase
LYKNKGLQVLLIDNYDSFTFNIVNLLQQCNVTDMTIMKNDAIDVDHANTFEKIIISPGPKIPKESGQLMQCIHHFKHSKNILGICLGHQALAEAFGATLYQLPFPQHGMQVQLTHQAQHSIYNKISDANIVGLYHSWAVDAATLPDCFAVTASSNNVVMSIKHKQLPLHGVQFHPESYMSNCGKQMLDNWLGS